MRAHWCWCCMQAASTHRSMLRSTHALASEQCWSCWPISQVRSWRQPHIRLKRPLLAAALPKHNCLELPKTKRISAPLKSFLAFQPRDLVLQLARNRFGGHLWVEAYWFTNCDAHCARRRPLLVVHLQLVKAINVYGQHRYVQTFIKQSNACAKRAQLAGGRAPSLGKDHHAVAPVH